MAKVKPIKKPNKEGKGDDPYFIITGYQFQCPGCKRSHRFMVEPYDGPTWNFNGDVNKPTFSPSLDFTGGRYDENENWIDLHCHSFVKNGKIQFLNDCSHELAGQTVELPEVND